MLSALVTAFPCKLGAPAPETVLRTLGALVPAAIAGMIGDLVLIGPADFADLSAIADHAGCEVLLGENEGEVLRRALMGLRREHALMMRAGYVPGAGFLEELAELFGPGAAPFRAAILRERRDGAFSFVARRRVAAIVAHKVALLKLKPENFDRLAAQARSDRTLKCGARRIG